MKELFNYQHEAGQQPLKVLTTLCAERMMRALVERLASPQSETDYGGDEYSNGLRVIDSSSVEAYIAGDNHFTYQQNVMKMPFITSFIFTCIREKGKRFRLEFGASLS